MNSILMFLLYSLRVIITPSCWIRNHSIDQSFNEGMITALNDPEFNRIDEHFVELNGIKLWVCNYPYCYGCEDLPTGLTFLPSRVTVFKLHDAISRAGI